MKRILIADDDSKVCEPLRGSLVDAGYSVDVVHTGDAAVAYVSSALDRYDFVLMDQYFPPPGRDGIAATSQIHACCPSTRVILITQYGDGESTRKALQAGAYRYIFRPCDDEDILAVVRAAEQVEELEKSLRQPSPVLDLIENAGIGISVIDRTYHLLYLNRHQYEISRPDCHVGGTCWVEFNGDFQATQPCPWCPTKPALDFGETHEGLTVSFVRGDMRHFRVVSCPVWGRDGSVIAAVEFVRDITESHRADRGIEAAKETHHKLKAVLARICALGFSRARLYELSEDGSLLMGREQHGELSLAIKEIVLPVKDDPCSQSTLASKGPRLYRRSPELKTLFNDLLGRSEIDEWVEVPLVADAVPVGKIVIDNRVVRPLPPGVEIPRPKPITEQHFDEVMRFAVLAANEIAGEREHSRIKRESTRLRELRRLSVQVARRGELAADLDEIVKSCALISGVQGVHLRLASNRGLELTAGKGAYYDAARTLRRVVAFSDVNSGAVQAWIQQQRMVEPAADSNPNFALFKDSVTDTGLRAALDTVKSFASFPILFEGQGMGVLSVQSDKPAYFGLSVCEAIEDFAAMTGPLIRIEQLLEQLRRAATMAVHRIRAPGFAIRSRVDNWLRRSGNGDADPTFTGKTIASIGTASDRIARIVSDLSDFLLEPAVSIPRDAIDVNMVLRDGVSGMLASKPEVEFGDSLDPALPVAWLDQNALVEIVDELLVNACKAMADRGTITVSSRLATPEELRIHGLPSGPVFIRIAFSDSGPGIPFDKRDWVFEAHNTTYRGSSGLGLTFVRDEVRALGGAVRVEEQPGYGACFVLLLPINPKEVFPNA